jgi:proteasome lid subunit RPN8/RPN11
MDASGGAVGILRMTQAVFEIIRTHGEETYPNECCGVLLGQSNHEGRSVLHSVRAENIRADSAHNRYDIAPIELVRIEREARKQGRDIVGFYHSHPDHPAQWSATDFAEAHWIGCSYVITEVAKGKAAETNSFLLAGISEEDKRFDQETIELSDR